MNIIATRTITRFKLQFPDAESVLDHWRKIVHSGSYSSIAELRRALPTADNIKGSELVCFNICGNKYRLIVRITWSKTVFIKDFCTHANYSKKYC